MGGRLGFTAVIKGRSKYVLSQDSDSEKGKKERKEKNRSENSFREN